MVRISVELPDEVAEALARKAADSMTTIESVAAGTLAEAVRDEAALHAALEEAEAELAAGKGVPHEAVMDEMRNWAAAMRKRVVGR
jgi:predicted transcriptional regulator